MNRLTLLPLVAATLMSCTKDDRSVTYSATCDRCDLWFQSDAKTITLASVEGSWDVFVADTVIMGIDTIYTMDSTYAIGQWNRSVELPHDASPSLKGRNFVGSSITEIRMVNEGSISSATIVGDMQEETIH